MSQQLTVIMYHYIRELPNTKYPEIKALLISEFKEQLAYLGEHYTFVTVADCLNALYNGFKLPSNACLLTFDDGYIDHFENVFSILIKKNIQGVFFPSAKAVMEESVLDVNKIQFILASKKKNIDEILLKIEELLNDFRYEYGLRSNDYYFTKLAKPDRFDTKEVVYIKRLLQRELAEGLRAKIIDNLFKTYVTKDLKDFSNELYMSLDQLKIMFESGMFIGSHGYEHYWLDTISPEKQKLEIDRSLEFLSLIGVSKKNWIMCYPYGAFNQSLIEILKEKGCGLGFTTNINITTISKKNAYTLERLDTNDFPKKANSEPSSWTKKLTRNFNYE